MNITQKFLVNNDCYKAGRKIKIKGLMLHSTGANNTKLSRYIQPDDGVLGANPNNNDWNRGGLNRCVHGFIGKDKYGNIRTYQTLPWNYRGWHGGGTSNNTHIGVEICEDGLTDGTYFSAVYTEAVELFAFLCKQFNLTEKDIICYSEGYKKGIASNHGDVMHWFPKHGKSMDTFRADVKAKINAPKVVASPSILYNAHVQNLGWQGWKSNGETAGTIGQSMRLEALVVRLNNTDAHLEIEGHVEKRGWQSLRSNGEVVGTIGEELRLEAIKIRCNGLNVDYRVHVQNIGWAPWAKNGEVAGTTGEAKRIEAIEIKLV